MTSLMTDSGLQHKRILVLGDDSRMLLPVVRSLSKCQAEVEVGWCPADNPALKSRYIRQVHAIPRYVPGQDDWLQALNKLQREQAFDLILPLTEGAVYVLQTHRDGLQEPGSVYLLDDRAFRVVSSKEETYRLAHTLGIACPQTHTISPNEDPSPILEQIGLPVIIKPCSSVRDTQQLTKHFVRTGQTVADARAYIDYLTSRGSTAMLQRHFAGVGVGVETLAHRGKLLLAMQHRRLHETNGYGSTYRETVALAPELVDASSQLLAALDYSGVAMVEFRVNPETGKWVLLEINGRFWGSLPLAAAAGIDFPKYLVQLWLLDKRDFPGDYRLGVRSRSLEADLRWTWRRLRGKGRTFEEENEDCLGWSINQITNRQFVADLSRAVLLRDHFDSFQWSDPAPALYEFCQLGRAACARVGRRKRQRLPR